MRTLKEDLTLCRWRCAKGTEFPTFSEGTDGAIGPLFLSSKDTEGTTFPRRKQVYREQATVLSRQYPEWTPLLSSNGVMRDHIS